jgi:hypothetical protein
MTELQVPTQMKCYSEKIARYALSGTMLLTALAALAVPHAVQAQPANYTGQLRQINACVLVSSATAFKGGGNVSFNNPTPYVFYALENRNDYRPGGWDFVNPIAPSSVTAAIYNRWKTRAPKDPAFTTGSPQAQLFRIGAPVTKNIGAYWEVNLDTVSAATLSQFNVILMPLQGGRSNADTSFSENERELLRHYVDQGGVLWIENEGVNLFNGSTGQFFLPLQKGNATVNSAEYIVNPFHPLLTYPLNISPTAVANLGQYLPLPSARRILVDPTSGGVLNPRVIVPIVEQQGGGVTIYAGDYGAGHIVVTSSGVANDINGLIVGSGANTLGTNGVADSANFNDSAVSGDNFPGIPPVDLQLAYNICGWAGTVPVGAANARRTGATQETVGYGIATKWSTYPVAPSSGNPGSGGVIFKNATFYVDGQNILHAYDINPEESLSFNGLLPDDGIADFIYGTPYDEIWNYPLGNAGSVHYSTPSVVSVYDTNNNIYRDLLMVTGTNGSTTVFDALPRNKNTNSLSTTNNPVLTISLANGNNTTVFGQNPNAVNSYPLPVPGAVYADGVLFVPVYKVPSSVTTQSGGWHVMAVDLLASLQNGSTVPAFGANGTDGSTLPSTQTTTASVSPLGDIIGPLSVGYIRDNSTGATDEIAYAPVAGDVVDTPSTPPYVEGCWFRTRGDVLTQITDGSGNTYWRPQGNRAAVPWFLVAPTGGAMDLRPVFHITHLAADGVTILDLTDIPYSGGAVTVNYMNMNANQTQPILEVTNLNVPALLGTGDTYVVTADYAVDWPGSPVGTGTLSGTDLSHIATLRQYQLYVNTTPSLTSSKPVQPLATGGVAIGPDDSAILATSSGLQDQLMTANTTLPDRIYSVTPQSTAVANNQGRTRSAATSVNWMFSPMYSGSANGTTVRARLINSDTFRPKTSTDLINTGQVVQGGTSGNTQTNGLPASGFQVIGTPVVSNGVVYVVANVHFNTAPFTQAPYYYNATVVLALNEQINNTINLTAPLTEPPGSQLTLQQPNFSQAAAGTTNNLLLHSTTDQGTGDFTVDSTTDAQGNNIITALHLLNFQASGQDCFNVAVPMILVDPSGTQTPLTNASGYSPLDNLLWWVVIPYSDASLTVTPAGFPLLLQPELQDVGGSATSGPAVFGQTLYYNATYQVGAHRYGSIVTLDLQNAVDGRLIDGTTGISRAHVLATMTDPNTGGPFDLANAGVTTPVINPPAAAINTVVDGVAAGLAALDNQVTLIADSNRLIEVDALSNAVWTLNSTTSVSIVGGPLNSGNGGVSTQSVPLARPNTARHFTANVYAVADTDNSRIIQIDNGGQVQTEIRGLNNGLNFLKSGEPLTLNHPGDVQIYVDQQNNGTLTYFNRNTNVTYTYTGSYYAIHYVVADTGNYRALEILSAYNPTTGAVLNISGSDGSSTALLQQVIFSTRSLAEQNVNYRYRTIQEFSDPTTANGSTFMIAAVDNAKQSAAQGDSSLNGFDAQAEAPGGSLMIIQRAANGTDGDVASAVNSIAIPNANLTQIVRTQPVNGPTFFHEFDYVNAGATTTPVPRYLMCDASGCYLLSPRHVDGNTLNLNSTAYNTLVVEWMLTDTDYYYLTGRHLHAASIQRLTQAEIYTDANGNKAFAPHYLITNSYSGHDNINEVFGNVANVADGTISGEVFEIRSRDYFNTPNGAAAIDTNNDNVYNGYHYAGYANSDAYQLYYAFNNLLYPNVPSLGSNNPNGGTAGSSIVRMIPAETIPATTIANGAGTQYVKLPIIRSIGNPTNATITNLLQQPLFSERPF